VKLFLQIIIISAFIFSGMITCFAQQAGNSEGDKILPYKIHQSKLDNGLNVVTVPFDSPGLAAF
jgi:zinc protease